MPTIRPRVGYLALGGTIASIPDEPGAPSRPGLGAAQIAAAVPGLTDVADVAGEDLLQVSSARVTMPDLLRVASRARELVDGGADGVVVSQGTDSLEESAFLLDLVWDRPEPLVLTGAMRGASVVGADGPANLLASVRTAVSPQARDLGVLVVLGDELHAARSVRKAHTSSPAAFASWPGPVGWVVEDRVRVAQRPHRRPALRLPDAVEEVPPVALVTATLGDDGRLLGALPDLGYRGAVIAAFGGGHVHTSWLDPLRALVGRMPVVLASRTGAGEVLSRTYGYSGGEVELLEMGLVRAGALAPLQARLLLQASLLAETDVAQAFSTYAGGELR